MKYLKTFENVRDYKWYVAIYRADCDSDEDMVMKAKMLKHHLTKYWDGRKYIKLNFKICYIDPKIFPSYSECITFLLEKEIDDVEFPHPVERSRKSGNYNFTIEVREMRNDSIIEKTEIPDNDLDQFFTAKKYNL